MPSSVSLSLLLWGRGGVEWHPPRYNEIRRRVLSNVLHKMSYQEISRASRAVTAKKCTKKCGRVVVLVIKPVAFRTFSMPSLSSLLKLPVYICIW